MVNAPRLPLHGESHQAAGCCPDGIRVRQPHLAKAAVLHGVLAGLLVIAQGPVEAAPLTPLQPLAQQVEVGGADALNVDVRLGDFAQQAGTHGLGGAVEVVALVAVKLEPVAEQKAQAEGDDWDGGVLDYLTDRCREFNESFKEFARHNPTLLFCIYLALGICAGCASGARSWADFWGTLAEIYRTPRGFICDHIQALRWWWEDRGRK